MELTEEDYFPVKSADNTDIIRATSILRANIDAVNRIKKNKIKKETKNNSNNINNMDTQSDKTNVWNTYNKVNGYTRFTTKNKTNNNHIGYYPTNSAPPILPQDGCILSPFGRKIHCFIHSKNNNNNKDQMVKTEFAINHSQ